jgi:ABC-type glycerol-3-phosphate transport system substrate-binding protein
MALLDAECGKATRADYQIIDEDDPNEDIGNLDGLIRYGRLWCDPYCLGQGPQINKAIAELFEMGLLDQDCLSITQDDAAERFLGGEAALHVTGTWFYSEMARNWGEDWDMMTAPGPGGKPVWCTGETEAMVIPKNAKDPDAAGRFLDYCVSGNGAKILRELGNVLSSTKFGELAIPQVQHLPVVTGEESSLLIFGWLPQESQDAYQQGLGGITDRSVPVEQWAADVQKAWEQNIEDGKVPADRNTLL